MTDPPKAPPQNFIGPRVYPAKFLRCEFCGEWVQVADKYRQAKKTRHLHCYEQMSKKARAFVNADEAVQKARLDWIKSKETYDADPGWTGWCRAELDMAKSDALKRFKEQQP